MAVAKVAIKELEDIAYRLRRQIIRVIGECKSGHQGGSLSAIDILTALYFRILRIDPQNPYWEERDRFILSKGHASVALYVTLAERGYFPSEFLFTYAKIGSALQGHPDMLKTPGVDFTSGSLGQAFSVAIGMALGGRLDHRDFKVFVMVGDGEINEGQIWEGAMFAAKYKLNNLIAILDYNKLQVCGPTSEVMPTEPLREKWEAFNWQVREIDGHNLKQIVQVLEEAKNNKGAPLMIIAHTIKGKGVSFMENQPRWHAQVFTNEDYKRALAELPPLEERGRGK